MSAPQLILITFVTFTAGGFVGGISSALFLLWLLRRLGTKAFASQVGGYLAAVAEGRQR